MTTRNVRPFVHLRVLSSYSLGLGLSTPTEICQHAQRVGFDSVALTDVSGTYGFVEFHRAAREAGIKPIYGVLVFLDWRNPPERDDTPHWLTLLALDRTGLRHVSAAASISAIRRERGDGLFAADLEGITDGVVAIAGAAPRLEHPSPRHLFLPLVEMFHDRLFVESRSGLHGERAAAQERVLADARALGVAPVLVQDVRFVGPAKPQLEELLASADDRAFEHRVFGDARAGGAGADDGMRTAADMSEWYDRDAEAYSNAAVIAALVQPDLLDALEEDPGAAAAGSLAPMEDARATLCMRVDAAFAPAAAEMDVTDRGALREILDRELESLARTGLESAFLKFEGIARRARDAGIALGPASGLAFQSKCAYLLGLTSFDPYAVDDAFHPAFVDAVGDGCVLDVQVAPDDRPRLLAALNRAFDDASVGYVPTVEHITAARALRIVAKRLGVAASEYEDAARVASRHQGVSLRELAEENRTIGIMYRQSAAFRELVAHAASIEGLPFGYARTKRTLVVSPRPLRDFLGYTVSPDTGEHFVQSTRDSFPTGAVSRIDVSTLHALAILGTRDAEETSGWRRTGAPASELKRVAPAGAPGARSEASTTGWAGDRTRGAGYDLIEADDLDGIYLLEGAPRRLAPAFGIQSFDDLVLFVALLRDRASSLSLGDRLVAFRGEPLAAPAEATVGNVLTKTNGWLLFKDQVRDVVARLTGLASDDAARLAHRFRDHAPGNLAALRREFLSLTVEQGVSFEDASAWFGRLVRHSTQVMDRQRVIAECLITQRCLAMKAAQPLEFMARVLDHATDDERRARYREALGRRWLPPDARTSGRGFQVEGKGIRAPLWAINGVSREASDRFIRARSLTVGTVSDKLLIQMVKEYGVSNTSMEALLSAGLLRPPGGHEAAPEPESRGAAHKDSVEAQLGIPLGVEPGPAASPPAHKEGNSTGGFRVLPTVLEFYPHPNATPVEIVGRIRNLREFRSAAGKPIGFFELFDASGSVRVFAPWERVARAGTLSDGSRAVVRGKVRLRDGRKVCDALEVVLTEEGMGHGETSPDNPATGDS
jgi:DNA polymerase III subunit alpha